MLTGAISPSGARKAGQDAMADASYAHEARIARFSERLSAVVGNDIARMAEHRAGVKKGVKVQNVVVSGRRPHGCLHSMTR